MNSSPSLNAGTAHLREEALDWFVRRQDQGFSADEELRFQAWLAGDEARRQAFAHWQDEWSAFDEIPRATKEVLLRDLAREQVTDAASAQDANAHEGRQPQVRAQNRPPRSVPRRRILIPAFAVVAFAVVAGGSGQLAWRHWQSQPVFVQAFSTQRGQQSDVPLPDGSRLRLDAATRLEVTYYRQRREVNLLGGQAVFAVQGDPKRPFEVIAGSTRATAVGTRFAVRHLPGMQADKSVVVAVEEGQVKVEPVVVHAESPRPTTGAQGAAVLLTAGQQVFGDAVGVLSTVLPVSPGDIAPWRENRVRFDSVRLDWALAEWTRYRDSQLVIRDPAVAALQITGVFDPRDLETFRRVLPASLPVKLKETERGVAELVLAR